MPAGCLIDADGLPTTDPGGGIRIAGRRPADLRRPQGLCARDGLRNAGRGADRRRHQPPGRRRGRLPARLEQHAHHRVRSRRGSARWRRSRRVPPTSRTGCGPLDPAPGSDGMRMPGDPEREARKARAGGIVIDAQTVAQMEAAAAQVRDRLRRRCRTIGTDDDRGGAARASYAGLRVFVYHRQVSFGDCDPAGIAFYPNFYRWFDEAVHALMNQIGWGWRRTANEMGWLGLPCAQASARLHPAGHPRPDHPRREPGDPVRAPAHRLPAPGVPRRRAAVRRRGEALRRRAASGRPGPGAGYRRAGGTAAGADKAAVIAFVFRRIIAS